jgi:hypothetical protein
MRMISFFTIFLLCDNGLTKKTGAYPTGFQIGTSFLQVYIIIELPSESP